MQCVATGHSKTKSHNVSLLFIQLYESDGQKRYGELTNNGVTLSIDGIL